MKNIYHSDIMSLLIMQGGEGMRLCTIARRVYNKHVDLFNSNLDYTDLRLKITSYLWSQSKRKDSPFIRIGYGIYAVKPDIAVQLDLFWDMQQDLQPERPSRNAIHNHVQLTFQF